MYYNYIDFVLSDILILNIPFAGFILSILFVKIKHMRTTFLPLPHDHYF